MPTTRKRPDSERRGGSRTLSASGRVLLTLAITGVLLSVVLGSTFAAVPDPDHTFYGLPTSNGALIETGEVTVVLQGQTAVLASYTLGERPEHGGRYVLRLPMEFGPAGDGSATRQGQQVEFYIDGTLAGQAAVGQPGETTALDLDVFFGSAPEIWVETTEIPEGDAGQTAGEVRVRLSRPVPRDVTFDWATQDGTALAAEDYLAASGQGTIYSGETSTFLPISVLGDTDPEPTESFYVVLSELDGAEFREDPDGSVGQVDVGPDDAEFITSVEDAQAIEGDAPSTALVTVIVEQGIPTRTPGLLDVDWELVSGTATGDLDFVMATGTLQVDTSADCPEIGLPCGTIGVEVLGDDFREGNEDLTVRVTAVSQGAIGRSDALLTLVDDERYLRFTESEPREDSVVLPTPTAVAISPDGQVGYVVSDLADSLTVFGRDPGNGQLDFRQELAEGVDGVTGLDGASAVAVSPDNQHVYVAGLFSDAIAVFSRNGGGGLDYVETVSQGAGGVTGLDGVVALVLSSDGDHLYAAARNSHAVTHFTRAGDGRLTFVDVLNNGTGATNVRGATALALSPAGDYLFLAAAVDSTVTAFSRDAGTGALSQIDVERDGVDDTSDLGDLVDGLNGARSVAVSPDGTTVYAAGELEDSVAAFSFDAASGELSFLERKRDGVAGVQGIEGASSIAVHPNGRWVFAAARGGGAVTVFERGTNGRLDWFETRRNGELERAEPGLLPEDPPIPVHVEGLSGASSLVLDAPGHFVYVTGQSEDRIAVFDADHAGPSLPEITSNHVVTPPAGPIVWADLETLELSWSGSTDDGVGVAGYNYVLDQFQGVDIWDTEAPTSFPVQHPHAQDPHTWTSPELSSGHYGFHLRACDTIGNCSDTVHRAEYLIDRTPPEPPWFVGLDGDVWDTIPIRWEPGADDHSGVAGYIYAFSRAPSFVCEGPAMTNEFTFGVTSASLDDGNWYFHICSIDRVDLRSSVVTYGPVAIDSGATLKLDRVTSVAPTPDDEITGAELFGMTQLRLDFSRQAATGGTGSALDVSHYKLVELGGDGTLESSCAAGLVGDDTQVPLGAAQWDYETNRLHVALAGTKALARGSYTLLVCDSLQDFLGAPFDGDANDVDGGQFARAFSVRASNLLDNPNSDVDASGWSIVGQSADVSFGADDASAAPTSGSVRLENSAGEDATLELVQCLELGGPQEEYRLSGRVRAEDTDGGSFTVSAEARFFASVSDCSGDPASTVTSTSVSADSGGAWLPVDAAGLLPPGASSVEVAYLLAVGSEEGLGAVQVDLDELVFSLEPLPELSVDGIQVTEGDSGTTPGTLTVSIDRAVSYGVTFDWATVEGTALAGVDFVAASDSGTIGTGSTSTTFQVDVLGDLELESDESFSVQLSAPVGAVFRADPDGSQATVDVIADDQGHLTSVEITDLDVLEGDTDAASAVRVVVDYGIPERAPGLVSIDWELVPGSAVEGVDYTMAETSGTLVVDTGVNCPEVSLPCGEIPFSVLGDDVLDGTRSFGVRLLSTSSGLLIDPEATVTLFDDERFLAFRERQVSDPGVLDGLASPVAAAVSPDGLHVYVASQSDDALSVFARNPATGELTFVEWHQNGVSGVSGMGGASAVAVSGDGSNVYVAGQDSGAVVVFTRDGSGLLTFVESHQEGVGGVTGLLGASALALSSDGQHVWVAGRDAGAIAHFTRGGGGVLTYSDTVSTGAGATSLAGVSALALSPAGDHLFAVATTGASLSAFAIDGAGALSEIDVELDGVDDTGDAAGAVDGLSGARAVAVSPDGTTVYVAGELDDAVAAFSFDGPSSELAFLEVQSGASIRATNVPGIEGASAVAVHPNGRFVFVAASSSAAVTVFERESSGALAWLETRRNGDLETLPDTRVEGLAGAIALAQVPGTGAHLYVGGQLDASLAVFEPDLAGPAAPSAASTSHTASAFSQETVIDFEWSGSSDSGVGMGVTDGRANGRLHDGVGGYVWSVDSLPGTDPSLPVTVTHGDDPHSASTESLDDGLWYVHLRACDILDNCSATVHLGPYGIDTMAPLAPTDLTRTNPVEDHIDVSFTAVVDAGAQPSGIAGYVHAFSMDPVAACGETATLGSTATSVSSGPLGDGEWYLHLCAIDNVGLVGPAASLGPLVVDTGAALQIDRVTAIAPPSDDEVDGLERLGMTQLLLDFNRPLQQSGAGSVLLLDHYQLVDLGSDGTLDSASCLAADGDDVRLSIDAAHWQSSTRRLSLLLTETKAVARGHYALLVCDTLEDFVGASLDGDADDLEGGDFVRSFEVGTSNLLENPNFDRRADSWSILAGAVADITSDNPDIRLAETSESLLLQNDTGGEDAMLAVGQCVALGSVPETFELGARVRVDDSDGGSVLVAASVSFYGAGAPCSGTPLSTVSSTEITADTAGVWESVEGRGRKPDGAAWAQVSLAATVGPEPGQSWVAVEIDDTVFAVVPMIFEDDFESGGTTAWSSSSP